MKRLPLLGVVLFLLVVTSAENSVAQFQRGEGLIRVKGANAMARMCDDLGRSFSAANPGMTVMVTGGGTDYGFEALFEKSADLVMATRKILVKELQAAALSDAKPIEVPFCSEMVAAITHPSNPVHELTLDQFGKVLRGLYTNWSEVGGPDQPIAVITSPQTSGTAMFLRQSVMEDDYFSSDAKARDFYLHIVKELSRKQPPALAYAPFLEARIADEKKQVRIVGLKKDEKSSAVYPSPATFKNGSYPLVMPLYFYWDDATVSPAVKRFVEFCTKQCRAQR